MNIDTNSDLIEFINKEKKNFSELNHKKVYRYFCRCSIKTIHEIKSKFKDKENEIDFKNGVIMGTNMLFHVFWILITYTNNLKLTIFLTERAILLFTEFILMSKEPTIKDDLCYTPNITDAISFSYKKTIGALKTSELLVASSSKISYLKQSSLIMKTLFQECYLNYFNDEKLQDKLEEINTNFRTLLFKIYYHENNHYIYEKLITIVYNTSNYNKSLMFIKIYLELYLSTLSKNITQSQLYIIFDHLFEKFKDEDYNCDTIEIKDFKKTFFYHDMKKFVFFKLNE